MKKITVVNKKTRMMSSPMSVSEAGRKGGKSKSKKKLAAIAKNLQLANKAKNK